MEKTGKNIIRLHTAENFNPAKYTINIKPDGVGQGGKYLPVHARIMWFRLEHPEGKIQTKIISAPADGQALYIVKAAIADGPSQDFAATAYGSHLAAPDKNNPLGIKALECAETEAVGRALLFAGYGTLMAGGDLAEGDLADSPVQDPPAGKAPKPTVRKNRNPEERILETRKTMTKEMALGTIVPCGRYTGKTYKELLMQKKKEEVLYFAHSYTPSGSSGYAAVAAARMIEEGYQKKTGRTSREKHAGETRSA